MAELAVVRRYARALFDSAHRAGTVDQIEADLKAVDQVLRTSPRLSRVLRAPTIPTDQKKELLQRLFGSRVSPLAARFLSLVVERRRETILNEVFVEFSRLANEARNILAVQVTAATPLTDQERDALATALTQRTGKTVTLELKIDPQILGGLMLRMGDTVIDGSVRSRLNQLRDRLQSGRAA
jgi:F-type H+-transporting ATPase subunit delta